MRGALSSPIPTGGDSRLASATGGAELMKEALSGATGGSLRAWDITFLAPSVPTSGATVGASSGGFLVAGNIEPLVVVPANDSLIGQGSIVVTERQNGAGVPEVQSLVCSTLDSSAIPLSDVTVSLALSEPSMGSFDPSLQTSGYSGAFSSRAAEVACSDSVANIEAALASSLGGNFVVRELTSSSVRRSLAIAFVSDELGSAAAAAGFDGEPILSSLGRHPMPPLLYARVTSANPRIGTF